MTQLRGDNATVEYSTDGETWHTPECEYIERPAGVVEFTLPIDFDPSDEFLERFDVAMYRIMETLNSFLDKARAAGVSFDDCEFEMAGDNANQ